jgi:hypothetical protein
MSAFQRGDMVTVGKGRRPAFRYLKPDDTEPRLAWLEIPFTGRVFRFPALFLVKAPG